MKGLNFEFIIHDKPNHTLFYQYIDRIIKDFNGHLIERMEHLDHIYCDFMVHSECITLHQDTYLGISIFPKEMLKSGQHARDLTLQIYFRLRYPIEHEQTWVLFDNGREDEINYLLDIIINLRKTVAASLSKNIPHHMTTTISCRICGSKIMDQFWELLHDSTCSACYKKFLKSKKFSHNLDALPKVIKFVN